MIEQDGKLLGSALIGQNFTGPRYFLGIFCEKRVNVLKLNLALDALK